MSDGGAEVKGDAVSPRSIEAVFRWNRAVARRAAGHAVRLALWAAIVVPLLLVNVRGRRYHIHSGVGWSTYERVYGWPCIHARRTESQPWGSFASTQNDPLRSFRLRGVVANGVVVLAVSIGSLFTLRRLRALAAHRQFSLSGLLVGCALAALCAIIKYDRWDAPFWEHNHFWGALLPPGMYFPVTASPPYVHVPILVGIAMGLYACTVALLRVGTVTWSVLRRAPATAGSQTASAPRFQSTVDALLVLATLAAVVTGAWCWWETTQPWVVTAVDRVASDTSGSEGPAEFDYCRIELSRGFQTIEFESLSTIPADKAPRVGDRIELLCDLPDDRFPFNSIQDTEYRILD
jgi:hypothetical protein